MQLLSVPSSYVRTLNTRFRHWTTELKVQRQYLVMSDEKADGLEVATDTESQDDADTVHAERVNDPPGRGHVSPSRESIGGRDWR